MKKVVIFDCDGTILDTFNLIEKTVFATFEKMLPNYKLTLEEAHSFFGPLLNDTFKKYANTEEEVSKLVECYRNINEQLMPKYICAYDGIEELLKELKKQNYIITIVSNKVTDAVVQGLEICNIDKYFDLVIGAEKLKVAKPDPNGIYQILTKYNVDQSVMIGDTLIDIKTGQNANIKTIGVTWCKTTEEQFKQAKADYVVHHPKEILKIVGEI